MSQKNPLPPINYTSLLKNNRISPRKSLGQNFLIDDNILNKIVTSAQITENTVVLEIGSGIGSLTRHLCHYAKYVYAIEIDKRLIPISLKVLSNFQNYEIIQGDILTTNLNNLALPKGYVVAANIPYYITSRLIRHLLESNQQPSKIIITVQQEVAERICAKPGEMSILALSVQYYGHPEIKFKINKNAFYPVPKVDSAVLEINLKNNLPLTPQNERLLFQLIKHGFSQKRKMIINTLSIGLRISKDELKQILQATNISPDQRPETLSLDDWILLTETMRQYYNHPS